MELKNQLNSPVMFLICGSIVLVVALACVVFAVRAYRAGKAIGMDVNKMKRTIVASATFAVLPSIGILLGVIALSGNLGTAWPWLRLSVIGALHYETQVAGAAAEAVGMKSLSIDYMTPGSFATIALLMSVCIIWGMVFSLFNCKRYTRRLGAGGGDKTKKKSALSGFGDIAMTAMFIGLVSAYLGSYVGGFVSGEGLFRFAGDWIPLAVALVGAAAMRLFLWIQERWHAAWVESFSIAGSMLIAMTSAIFLKWLA